MTNNLFRLIFVFPEHKRELKLQINRSTFDTGCDQGYGSERSPEDELPPPMPTAVPPSSSYQVQPPPPPHHNHHQQYQQPHHLQQPPAAAAHHQLRQPSPQPHFHQQHLHPECDLTKYSGCEYSFITPGEWYFINWIIKIGYREYKLDEKQEYKKKNKMFKAVEE